MNSLIESGDIVGDTMLMPIQYSDGEPWFPHEVEPVFRKWERGGE